MSTPKDITNVELVVPELGTITGICFDGATSQYLGVPYGVVPNRFRRPQPSPTPWPDGKWDGTKVRYAHEFGKFPFPIFH